MKRNSLAPPRRIQRSGEDTVAEWPVGGPSLSSWVGDPQQPIDRRKLEGPAKANERKRRWQKARRATDPDYRDNDVQASRLWRRRHRDYWPTYRRNHTQSVIRNRIKQRERDRAKQRPVPRRGLDRETAPKVVLVWLGLAAGLKHHPGVLAAPAVPKPVVR